MEYLPAIISALGTIIAAWFAYNQYSKNKLTDLKIEKFKKDEETKSIRRADNSSIVYGELWSVLHELDADRVYIVQPHPLGKYAKSILSSYGCRAAIIKRLNDNRHDWIGSIFCEFTRPLSVSEENAREIMHTAAMNIQYLLPEYR